MPASQSSQRRIPTRRPSARRRQTRRRPRPRLSASSNNYRRFDTAAKLSKSGPPASSVQYHVFVPFPLPRSVWRRVSPVLRVVSFTALGTVLAAPAAPEVGTALAVPLLVEPIRIDGVLDDPGWDAAARVELAYEYLPGDNIEPPVRTEALIAYSQSHLYIGWRCHDPEPEKIRAHLMDRDDVETFIQDDHVRVTIDSFNDERRGFHFRVNPLGIQADAIFSESGGFETSFDMIWKSAGRIDAEGYSVEVAIPFSQLRFAQSSAPQTWGFDLQRLYPRSVRHAIASQPRDRNRNCDLCQATKLSGFADIQPGRNVELTPTLTASQSELLEAPFSDRPEVSDDEAELGLSARWSPNPNLSLNLAVNPDFSQVEADAAQLDVNRRFALFFEEKRPFFLEGADLFDTPIQAVFTRTIADPDWGVKFTGKTGANGFGLFAARDAINNLLLPGNQFSRATSIDEEVDNGVLRYRRDIGRNSIVGLLWTGREGQGDYRNHVVGADAFLRFDNRNTLQLQYLRSETRYPTDLATELQQPLDSFSDDAFLLGYNYDSRSWDGWLWIEDRGDGFRADSGFVPRADLRSINFGAQRTFWGEAGDWYDQWNSFVRYRRIEDQAGQLSEEIYEAVTEVEGPLQSELSLELAYRNEFFDGILHEDLFEAEIEIEVQPSGALRLEFEIEHEDAVDLANNRVGEQLTLEPGLEWKVGRRVNLQLDQTWRRFELPAEAGLPGGELFEVALSQLRLVYNLNVRSFARLILQYEDLSRDPDLFPRPVEASEENLLAQLLYAYKINPRTVLFAGYSENRAGVDDISLTQTDRIFFLKLGYAWAP